MGGAAGTRRRAGSDGGTAKAAGSWPFAQVSHGKFHSGACSGQYRRAANSAGCREACAARLAAGRVRAPAAGPRIRRRRGSRRRVRASQPRAANFRRRGRRKCLPRKSRPGGPPIGHRLPSYARFRARKRSASLWRARCSGDGSLGANTGRFGSTPRAPASPRRLSMTRSFASKSQSTAPGIAVKRRIQMPKTPA
jgi:hypothetical protein